MIQLLFIYLSFKLFPSNFWFKLSHNMSLKIVCVNWLPAQEVKRQNPDFFFLREEAERTKTHQSQLFNWWIHSPNRIL